MKKYLFLFISGISITIIQASFIHHEPMDEAALGKLLFFDPILSKDSTVSCASCHKPGYAFSDTSPTSIGVAGAIGTRNTPSAMNVAIQPIFFWDGRAKSLEEQALAPIENPAEMDLSVDKALIRLNESDIYRENFKAVFNSEPTRENLARAIADFERSLETSDSPFDDWKFSDNPNAVTASARRGFTIFNRKGKCITCHFGSNLTLNEFRNIGLFNGKNLIDSGRSLISGKIEDVGKFKIPGLRNIAVTAPYMHNGMFKTLKEVIEFYNEPGRFVPDAVNRDTSLAKPLGLTEKEKNDLEAFLLSLTDKRFAPKKVHP